MAISGEHLKLVRLPRTSVGDFDTISDLSQRFLGRVSPERIDCQPCFRLELDTKMETDYSRVLHQAGTVGPDQMLKEWLNESPLRNSAPL